MNISKNSWHYRTIRNMNRIPSRSLCLYFWQVVLCSLFLYLIGPAILVLGGACIAGGLPLAIGGLLTHTADSDLLWNWIVMVKCWSVGVGALVGFFAVVWFIVSLWGYIKSKLSNVSIDKEPSVLVSYVKAKKQKVCPIIEFKD